MKKIGAWSVLKRNNFGDSILLGWYRSQKMVGKISIVTVDNMDRLLDHGKLKVGHYMIENLVEGFY